jgi:CPA2 family monovalent cation:H+ antiporter-2
MQRFLKRCPEKEAGRERPGHWCCHFTRYTPGRNRLPAPVHDLSIITTLAGGLAAALVLGWVTQRLGLSTLVGYMLAGILVGPYTPGFVADTKLATQMAEIGVILLMFGVGMHFHPQELLRVWRVAVPGAIAQSAVATVAGWACARAFGWSDAAGFVFGMALAVASTVVLMRMLVDQDRLATHSGHVAVGWLIVEDLFTVVALVVLPVLAMGGNDARSFGLPLLIALAKAAAFAGLVWIVGIRVVSNIMERMARTKSEELFTLTVFVMALGIAIIAAEGFQVSVALGAFFAGLVVGRSRFGPQASSYMTPFRDVFSALFFVSVGMLFDPGFVLAHPLIVVAALVIVLVVKPLVALAIVLVMRGGRETAATVAVGLAQIGEFSFILASLGQSLNVLPPEGFDALVVAAIFSIALNPILFRLLRRGVPAKPPAEAPESRDDRPLVVAGEGELARRVIAQCAREGIAAYAVSADVDAMGHLRETGAIVVFGHADRADVLRAAHIERARTLVVTNEALADKMRVVRAARDLNPRIAIVAAAASSAERAWLDEFGATSICDALEGLTEAMVRSVRQTL